jgi:hypothetical protein
MRWQDVVPTILSSVVAAAMIGTWLTTVEMREAVTKMVTIIERVVVPSLTDHENRIRELERKK